MGCLNGSIPLYVGQASLKYRVRLPGANLFLETET